MTLGTETIVALRGIVMVARWNAEDGVTGTSLRTDDGTVYLVAPDGISLVPYLRAAVVVWGSLVGSTLRVTRVVPAVPEWPHRKAS